MKVTLTGKYKLVYSLGSGARRVQVCRNSFELAYNISHWYTDDCVKKIKANDVNVDVVLNDRTSFPSSGVSDIAIKNLRTTMISNYQSLW